MVYWDIQGDFCKSLNSIPRAPRYKLATEKSFPKCHLGYFILGSMHPKQINCDRRVRTKTACPGSAKPNPADTEWQEGVPPLQLPRNTSPPNS